MPSRLNPYLHFKDNARAAMEFYQSVFGGELSLQTFGDFGASSGPSDANLIMHSQLEAPNGFTLMASDTPAHMTYEGKRGYDISLSGDDEAGLTDNWNKLSDGATITMPLAKAQWGDSFGMLVDKFGTSWLVNISAAK